MWYYKVMVGILIFPWSLLILMVVGAVRYRYAQKAQTIVLPPAPLRTGPALSLGLPEPVPALACDPDSSRLRVS